MAYKVAIIGSFRKYYKEILEIIKDFRESGIWILSPKESHITDSIDDFVVFGSDNPSYKPEEIQMITLEKIINADAVYVYNPQGYVGRTTCYEIGVCFSREIPIFFSHEVPKDLPIPIVEDFQVLSPGDFKNKVLSGKFEIIKNYALCNEANRAFERIFDYNLNGKRESVNKKSIVICGSMQFYDDMLNCQRRLKEMDIPAIVPKEEGDSLKYYSETQLAEFKRKVSSLYLRKIRDKSTYGVLIYNERKKGLDNYIGANTLVELAMAFVWNRKIYLLNNIFEPLRDELLAWDCTCLKGDLSKLRLDYLRDNINVNMDNEYVQLSLFDGILGESK